MDAKISLSINKEVIEAAKKYAKEHGISLSRLTEILLRKLTTEKNFTIEEFPIADWVEMDSEKESEYLSRARDKKEMKAEFYKRKK